jgi:hypothetical protein
VVLADAQPGQAVEDAQVALAKAFVEQRLEVEGAGDDARGHGCTGVRRAEDDVGSRARARDVPGEHVGLLLPSLGQGRVGVAGVQLETGLPAVPRLRVGHVAEALAVPDEDQLLHVRRPGRAAASDGHPSPCPRAVEVRVGADGRTPHLYPASSAGKRGVAGQAGCALRPPEKRFSGEAFLRHGSRVLLT